MKSLFYVRQLFVVVNLFLLACLVYYAFNYGMADIYARPAIHNLKNVIADQKNYSDENWIRLINKLNRAYEFDRNNPNVHHYLASAIDRYNAQKNNKLDLDNEARQQAYNHYRTAISARPTWPFSWVNLVLLKSLRGDTDDEYRFAVQKAIDLGPWEAGVLRVLILTGLRNWKNANAEERKFIFNLISKSIHYDYLPHRIRVLNIVKDYGFIEYVCLIHDGNEAVVNFCKKSGKI